jgi:hypothetical protein
MDLFARYLERQIDAQSQGLGYPEPTGEAVPHDAVPVQPVDPRLAWQEALAAAALLQPAIPVKWIVPPEWPALVAQQEPAVALAFCLGNFPQLVRNVHPLLTREPMALRDGPHQPLNLPALGAWAAKDHDAPHRLLAAAVLRLAGHLDRAEERLAMTPSEEWRALHANEVAALAWHRGQTDKALTLWRQAPDSAPVLFNRGMAALFLGHSLSGAGGGERSEHTPAERAKSEAVAALREAVAILPESSPWHHLGQLYLALAMTR